MGRNAALPPFTQLSVSIALVFGGSLLIEWIFVYEGSATCSTTLSSSATTL